MVVRYGQSLYSGLTLVMSRQEIMREEKHLVCFLLCFVVCFLPEQPHDGHLAIPLVSSEGLVDY